MKEYYVWRDVRSRIIVTSLPQVGLLYKHYDIHYIKEMHFAQGSLSHFYGHSQFQVLQNSNSNLLARNIKKLWLAALKLLFLL